VIIVYASKGYHTTTKVMHKSQTICFITDKIQSSTNHVLSATSKIYCKFNLATICSMNRQQIHTHLNLTYGPKGPISCKETWFLCQW